MYGYSFHMPTPPKWTRGVSPIEAAKFYGVSAQTVRNWARKGLIEASRTPSGLTRVILPETEAEDA